MNFLERAQILVELGFPVIPVLPRLKQAFKDGWQNLATTDLEVLRQWNTENCNYNSGAVAKLEFGLILDLDAPEIVEKMSAEGIRLDRIRTFRVRGGKPAPCGHVYFKQSAASRALGNFSQRIYDRATGKQVSTTFELKSNNTYVVGPGSRHPNGAEYTVVENAPLAVIPDEFVEWTRRQPKIVWIGEGVHGQNDAEAGKGNGIAKKRPGKFRDRIPEILERCEGQGYEAIKIVLAEYEYAHRHEFDQALAQFLFLKHDGDEKRIQPEFERLKLHQDKGEPYNHTTLEYARQWFRDQRTNGKVFFSEDELALLFSDRHADDLRYTATWGKWSGWDETRWKPDDTLHIFDQAREVCREIGSSAERDAERRRLENAQTIAAVERLARSDRRHAMRVDQWDADPWLLNTPGGTVDLRTGELSPHRREDYITKITAVVPGGACPRWRSVLARITAERPELESYLQRAAGYWLTASTREQCLFFCYGTGANGKTQFLNAITGMMGDYAATAPADAFVVAHGEHHPTDLAGLRGSRLVTSIETDEGQRWAESRIKTLTGGDAIAARFMRQDFFTFVPTFKLVIAGNHKPSLRSVNEAIRRRFHLVPFDVTIPEAERDLHLTEKLRVEWSGILAWAIEGCLKWQREGLNQPDVVREATNRYLESEDHIARWIEECCDLGPRLSEKTPILYQSYCRWCEANNERELSSKSFSPELELRGFPIEHNVAGNTRPGIRVKSRATESS